MLHKSWAAGTVRLKWQFDKAGYRLRYERPVGKFKGSILGDDDGPEGVDEPDPDIVALGGQKEDYEVAIGEKNIFLELANTALTGKAIQEFVGKWGLPGKGSIASLGFLLDQRRELRNILEKRRRSASYSFRNLAELNENWKLGSAQVKIARKDAKGPIEVLWYVEHLSSFMWLELCYFLGAHVDITTCENKSCGKLFTRAHSKGPAPKVCSNACKQALYRSKAGVGLRRKRSQTPQEGLALRVRDGI